MSKHTLTTMQFNITLPKDIGQRLKAADNHSALIAESLRQKFEREDKERLAATLSAAYAEAAEEDKQLSKDWDATIGDGL